MKQSSITDKEWLDLAWKHFQQHAQQRILYFNYFVIFSTILTTGLVTTFQNNFQAPFLGIGIGLIQSYLSFLFRKIDDRNRFLTRLSENSIKRIESDCMPEGENPYKLFTEEENETKKQNENDKNKMFLIRQFSHGKSYRIIFTSFFIIGLLGAVVSFVKLNTSITIDDKKNEVILNAQSKKIDSLFNLFISQEKFINNTQSEITIMNLKLDSLKCSISKLAAKKKKNL